MKSYNFTDSKPIGKLSNKEIIELEHKYRLILKKSGFNDIEMWDNRPKAKKKKLNFIKGRIRFSNYKCKGDMVRKYSQTEQYIRIISLYAYHCDSINPKYSKALQELSLAGSLRKAMEISGDTGKYTIQALSKYVRKNLTQMIEFVNRMDNEDE